eukprot:3128847-Lingulodinium_polyedra.AAC.1
MLIRVQRARHRNIWLSTRRQRNKRTINKTAICATRCNMYTIYGMCYDAGHALAIWWFAHRKHNARSMPLVTLVCYALPLPSLLFSTLQDLITHFATRTRVANAWRIWQLG